MEKKLKFLAALVLVISFFSCSDETIDTDFDLTGVWELEVSTLESVVTKTLVFGDDNMGLSLEKVQVNSEISSSALPFIWSKSGEDVRISLENAGQQDFTLNLEKQLVLKSSGDSVFEKISEDYSKYY